MNFALPFALAVLVALYTWWHYRRVNAMVAAWAQSNGYTIKGVGFIFCARDTWRAPLAQGVAQ